VGKGSWLAVLFGCSLAGFWVSYSQDLAKPIDQLDWRSIGWTAFRAGSVAGDRCGSLRISIEWVLDDLCPLYFFGGGCVWLLTIFSLPL